MGDSDCHGVTICYKVGWGEVGSGESDDQEMAEWGKRAMRKAFNRTKFILKQSQVSTRKEGEGN